MKRLALPLTLCLSATAFAAAPDHAKLDAAAQKSGDKVELRFKVVPDAGLHINMEGPWKLELTGADGLALAKTTYVKSDMDEKLPGFVVKTAAKPSKASGDVDYKLTAFVCTNDKTQCYREVHTGKLPWKA